MNKDKPQPPHPKELPERITKVKDTTLRLDAIFSLMGLDIPERMTVMLMLAAFYMAQAKCPKEALAHYNTSLAEALEEAMRSITEQRKVMAQCKPLSPPQSTFTGNVGDHKL